jgi:hypothetical protein
MRCHAPALTDSQSRIVWTASRLWHQQCSPPASPQILPAPCRLPVPLRTQVLEFYARRNGTRMPDRPLAVINPQGPGPSGTGSGSTGVAPPTDAPAPPTTLAVAMKDWHIARRTLVLAYAWMVICMTYYVSLKRRRRRGCGQRRHRYSRAEVLSGP